MDPGKLFAEAEAVLKQGRDIEAARLYGPLLEFSDISGVVAFRLGEIFNRLGQPEQSLTCHRTALEANEALARVITPAEHRYHHYVNSPASEVQVPNCTLCEKQGILYAVYNCITNADFLPGFDPVRSWLHCSACDHLWASAYPDDLGGILTASTPTFHEKPNPRFINNIGRSLLEVAKRAPAMSLLEVGCGAGEYTVTAVEMGFRVEGVELRPAYASAVAAMAGIPVYSKDFMTFPEDTKFGVVAMGDVLEHFANPPADVIIKARDLLVPNGLMHISTPNFRSAFSMITRDKDPMWRVCEHLNYFSRGSLTKLLDACGLSLEHYEISSRYNGSMEIIARLR